MNYRKLISTISLALVSLVVASEAVSAQQIVRLISGEKEPYIGERLDNNGYVYEVVEEALRREGYQLEVSFYPWARANHQAINGKFDGIFPVRSASFSEEAFEYSAPFPGDIVGLLKRKDNPATYQPPVANHRDHLINFLANKSVGVLRGSDMLLDLKSEPKIKLSQVSQELYNLDMLYAGRIDFALTDKYTATKIMIDQRPHYIGQLEFMYPPIAKHSLHIAFSKQSERHTQLVEAFNRGLSSMKQDNILEQILARHGLLFKQRDGDEKKRLVVGAVNNPDMKIMQSLSHEFEKRHPGVVIDWIEMDENVLRRRLLSDLALHDGQFDVMMIGNFEAPIWAEKGWLHPFSELPTEYGTNDIFPAVRQALSFNNKLYGLPFYAESVMTYYRKDLFEQAGIEIPDRLTYSDIFRFASLIHNPDKQVYGICLRGKPGWGENMALITALAHSFGARWFDTDWRPQLNSPEWQNALTYYQDLIVQFGPPNPAELGYTENLRLFANGHCGIWIDATVAAGQLFNPRFSKVADKVAFAKAPVRETTTNWLWVWALAIPESSKNKSLAQSYISWATSSDYINMVAERYGWISVPPGTRKSTYLNDEYQQVAIFSPNVASALQESDKAPGLKPVPYSRVQIIAIPEYVAIGTSVGNLVAQVIKGDIGIKEAQTRAQNLATKQMLLSGYMN